MVKEMVSMATVRTSINSLLVFEQEMSKIYANQEDYAIKTVGMNGCAQSIKNLKRVLSTLEKYKVDMPEEEY